MSRKHKKVCTTLNYIEHFLILASTVSGCISISAFASLLGIPIGIISSAVGLNIRLNIEVLAFNVLIDLNIIHDEFVLINDLLKEYDNMKEEIKHLKT